MKTGIVFEGGAFRTVFSCGVMDAFLENNIKPDYMIGTSAGAAYGVSYASDQIGRNLSLILNYCNDKRYMSFRNLINPKNKCYYGLKFAYEEIPQKLLPFDYEAYDNWNGEFIAAVTNVLTGEAEYLPYSTSDTTNTVLKATCALPLLFPFIYINNIPYLDGGLSDSIPYEEAFRAGCEKVVVVLTREEGYVKETSSANRILAKRYRKYPKLAECLLTRADKYNASVRRLNELEKEGKVIVIRPDSTDGFSRMEKDKEKIQALYDDGYNKGHALADKVTNFYSF